ncbi:MAG: DUF1127 domain-containing protein [Rhodospirillaceae bacterium]
MNKTECLGTYGLRTGRRPAAAARREPRAIAERVAEWCNRIAFRRSLKVLPDRMLAAMGMTRAQAAVEAAKPFWQA